MGIPTDCGTWPKFHSSESVYSKTISGYKKVFDTYGKNVPAISPYDGFQTQSSALLVPSHLANRCRVLSTDYLHSHYGRHVESPNTI